MGTFFQCGPAFFFFSCPFFTINLTSHAALAIGDPNPATFFLDCGFSCIQLKAQKTAINPKRKKKIIVTFGFVLQTSLYFLLSRSPVTPKESILWSYTNTLILLPWHWHQCSSSDFNGKRSPCVRRKEDCFTLTSLLPREKNKAYIISTLLHIAVESIKITHCGPEYSKEETVEGHVCTVLWWSFVQKYPSNSCTIKNLSHYFFLPHNVPSA